MTVVPLRKGEKSEAIRSGQMRPQLYQYCFILFKIQQIFIEHLLCPGYFWRRGLGIAVTKLDEVPAFREFIFWYQKNTLAKQRC